jgi:hypothetical protein
MVTTRNQQKQMVLRSNANSNTRYYVLESLKQQKNTVSEHDEDMSICSDITEIEEIEAYQERFGIRNKSEDTLYWYDVDIDFEDAHNAWEENKRKGENGTYYYLCGKMMKNGKKCTHAQCDKLGLYSGCKRHYAWEEKEHKYL